MNTKYGLFMLAFLAYGCGDKDEDSATEEVEQQEEQNEEDTQVSDPEDTSQEGEDTALNA